jgi:two-component system cell cycle response regulator
MNGDNNGRRSTSSQPHGSGAAVALVIDDSPTLRRVTAAMLEQTGMFGKVLTEDDGLGGFTCLRKHRVDVVLCDMNMPRCDGIRFLQLKSADPTLQDIPVLMLTSDEDVHNKVRALELGACDYVSKGASAAEVRARVGVHLKLKRARDELNAQREELQRLTRTDSLTGLANRRWLDECLEQELSRCTRYSRPMSLVMIDLDHFKQLNDRHGHQAGDQVLRHTADLVRKSIRRQDLAARYGGEEMTVVLPETPLDRAEVAAERIRAAIAGSELVWRGRAIKVTASLGVAGVPALPAANGEDLLRLADAALYQAKSSGRNCVVLAQLEERPARRGAIDPEAAARAAQRWSAKEGNQARPPSGSLQDRTDSGPIARDDRPAIGTRTESQHPVERADDPEK